MSSFRTTRWSVVRSAGRPGEPEARAALETLCQLYWLPLYAFARQRGHDEHAASDLTQGFFGALLEKNWVDAADQERGRFRTFLLTAFTRWIGRERAWARAEKRGGSRVRLSLDFEEGERCFTREPTHDATPEKLFERHWALTILGEALEATERDMAASGRADLFRALRPLIGGGGEVPSYRAVAESLGMTEGSVKVAAHRLRARYREHLRRLVGDTLCDGGDTDDELRHLLAALGPSTS